MELNILNAKTFGKWWEQNRAELEKEGVTRSAASFIWNAACDAISDNLIKALKQ